MTMKNQNFSMVAGDTIFLQITVTEDDDITSIDLTGCSITWILKKTVKAPIILVTKTLDNGITIDNIQSGIFTVKLENPDTHGLVGRMYHEAKIVDVNGDVSTVTIGLVTFIPSGS